MNPNASAGAGDSPEVLGEEVADYERMLEVLDAAIEEAEYKINGDGRLRDIEREKVRVKYLRVIGYLVGQRRQVTQDRDLEQLTQDVEQLKKERGIKV